MNLKIFTHSITHFIFSLLGFALVWISTSKYGIGLIPDSSYYLMMAETFAKSGQVMCYEGYTFSLWPPLYPILVGTIVKTGVDALVAARWINALAFAATIYLCGQQFQKKIPSPALAIAFSLSLAVFYPVYMPANFALTETLFILLLVLFVFAADRYSKNPGWQSLALMALFASLCWLQRYIGFAVVLAAGLVVLQQKIVTRRKIQHLFISGLITGLPMLLWMLRNYSLGNGLVGPRTWGELTSMGENLQMLGLYLVNALLPFVRLSIFIRTVILLLLLCSFCAAMYVTRNKVPGKFRYEFQVTVIYLVCLLLLAWHNRFVPVYDRYIALVMPFVLAFFFLAVYYLLDFFKQIKSRSLQSITFALTWIVLAGWVAQNGRVTVQHVLAKQKHGAGGFSVDYIRNNAMEQWLDAQTWQGEIYTNHLSFCYALMRGHYIRDFIHKDGYGRKEFYRTDSTKYIIMLDTATVYNSLDAKDVSDDFKLRLLYHDETGSVYEARKR